KGCGFAEGGSLCECNPLFPALIPQTRCSAFLFPNFPSVLSALCGEILASNKIFSEPQMKFAKITFYIAGIYGLLVITPLYFIFDKIGQQDPPPVTHPGFYYGFVGTALAWQLAFLVVATDPIRFRPIILPSIVETVTYAIA